MKDSREKNLGESSTFQKSSKRQKQHQRHPAQQIQSLEAFFKECQYPDEDQRNQLGKEVGLDPKQIVIWFQNKRSQTKTEKERSDGNILRSENEKFRHENMTMKEALKNIICPQCDGPPIEEEERVRNLENMKMENQRLREEYTKVSNIISSSRGKSVMMGSNLAPQKSIAGSSSNLSDENSLSKTIYGSPIGSRLPIHQENNHNIPIMAPLPKESCDFHLDNSEKSIIFEIVGAAIDEMLELFQENGPLWIKSSNDKRWSIDRECYDRKFPNSYPSYKSTTSRIESSKDCGAAPMAATELIKHFLDPIKWMNMFPTIVTEARIIEVLHSGNMGDTIQLMYGKLHILSPLVEAREFFFLRCCKQLDQTTWTLVDVSYDLYNEVQTFVPFYTWKYPSGCVIQDMGNEKSKITWIEHVQVDERNQISHIFRDLLCKHQTYGAKRWIVTLQRMSERYNFTTDATRSTGHDIKRGLNNIVQTSQRMVKSFCEILSILDKLDFSTSSELNNSYRFSIRKTKEATQQEGFIATVATSLWLPLSFETIFTFLKDDKTRYLWDALTSGNNVTELARVSTGALPENNITIIQSEMLKQNDMVILQESSIDEMGAFLIYAPIDLATSASIVNGGDAIKVVLFPLGFIISPDGRLVSNWDSSGNGQNGSILTVAFQQVIYANNISISENQHKEAVLSVYKLLSSTVSNIKATLGCFD